MVLIYIILSTQSYVRTAGSYNSAVPGVEYWIAGIFILLSLIGLAVQIYVSVYRYSTRTMRRLSKGVKTQLSGLPSDYYVLPDVTVRNDEEVLYANYAVVSPYGIFVIREEYHTGTISGSVLDEYWRVMDGKKVTAIPNLTKKCLYFSRELGKVGAIPVDCIMPIVVMPEKTVLYVTTATPVVHVSQLRDVILSYQKEVFGQGWPETISDWLSVPAESRESLNLIKEDEYDF